MNPPLWVVKLFTENITKVHCYILLSTEDSYTSAQLLSLGSFD